MNEISPPHDFYPMEVTFLGTGTSQGIPVIGCDCTVCKSEDPKDKRFRSSILVNINKRNIIIDISPDFRLQMLENQISNLDAVLLTHEHNDHIIGLDDIRPINFKHHKNIPVLALERVLDEVKSKFHYAFSDSGYPGAPKLNCQSLMAGQRFTLFSEEIPILPLKVYHANLEILGFRIQNFAYITDANRLPLETMDLLMDLEVLVLNVLQVQKHFSHFSLPEALDIIKTLAPKRTFLTHLSHNLPSHALFEKELPENVWPSFDKLRVKI